MRNILWDFRRYIECFDSAIYDFRSLFFDEYVIGRSVVFGQSRMLSNMTALFLSFHITPITSQEVRKCYGRFSDEPVDGRKSMGMALQELKNAGILSHTRYSSNFDTSWYFGKE